MTCNLQNHQFVTPVKFQCQVQPTTLWFECRRNPPTLGKCYITCLHLWTSLSQSVGPALKEGKRGTCQTCKYQLRLFVYWVPSWLHLSKFECKPFLSGWVDNACHHEIYIQWMWKLPVDHPAYFYVICGTELVSPFFLVSHYNICIHRMWKIPTPLFLMCLKWFKPHRIHEIELII